MKTRAKVCIDASFVVALLVPERSSQAAQDMWEGWVLDEVDILAPDLLRYEVTSAIYRKSFKNLISWEDSQAVLAQFLALDIIMLDPAPLPTRAAELARQFCRSNAYDAFCMALAEHLNCAFWTADERLYHTTHPVFSLINILS